MNNSVPDMTTLAPGLSLSTPSSHLPSAITISNQSMMRAPQILSGNTELTFEDILLFDQICPERDLEIFPLMSFDYCETRGGRLGGE